ncbi:MAG: metal ABC transporter solute-binding protein, Zn/Mn family [Acutalibacteraceae bacterium]
MSDVLSLLFSQQFLIRALVVGTLISLCCALLGVSLVLKRFSMIGDGLSHVGFGALAVACALNITPLYFALPVVVAAAFLLLRMNESGKIKGDAAIALISTGALAFGVMVTSMTQGMNVDIYNYMFGSILTMTDSDVVLSVILSAAVIILFVVFYEEIFAVTFDESFAKAVGTNVSVYNMLIAALTAVTIVIGMRMMGALLISSLIIFPSVISMRVCKSYKKVVCVSAAVSVVGFWIGLVSSIRFEAPTGASVVCVNIVLLAVFALIGRILSAKSGSFLFRIRKPLAAVIAVVTAAALVFTVFTGSVELYQKDQTSVVATSFAPYDFARQICGDKAQVTMLLSPGEESHTFEPTAADIQKIENCDVFIFGGGESDEWVRDILSSVDTSKTEVVEMMKVTDAVKEELTNGMEGEEEDEYDEHVWTSPKNAQKIVRAISDAVCKKDSENEEYYVSQTDDYLKQLDLLDKDFRALSEMGKGKYFVVGDRFPFRYLADEYSLTYYAAFPGCSAQTEANPVTIAFLTEKVKNENIPIVFKVDLSAGNVATSISKETSAEVMTLYSCHTVTSDDFENGETYISLMRKNLEALKAAFA